MQTETVCLFPGIRPRDRILSPLVPLFAAAVYITPAESGFPPLDELSPLAQEMLDHGLLRFESPAPLGQDQARFLSLISELRRRPADYAALALGAEGGDPVLQALRQQQGAQRSNQELLWRSRIVLLLGDCIEQQEADIQEGLRRIVLSERELLTCLREQEGASSGRQEPGDAAAGRLRLRLKAWRNLFCLGGAAPAADVFVADDREAFELLLEERGLTAQPDCILPLPASIAAAGFSATRDRFRAEGAGLIATLFRHPAGFPLKEWETLLERQYPAAVHGRCQLALQVLPEIRPQAFFRAAAAPLGHQDRRPPGTMAGFVEPL